MKAQGLTRRAMVERLNALEINAPMEEGWSLGQDQRLWHRPILAKCLQHAPTMGVYNRDDCSSSPARLLLFLQPLTRDWWERIVSLHPRQIPSPLPQSRAFFSCPWARVLLGFVHGDPMTSCRSLAQLTSGLLLTSMLMLLASPTWAQSEARLHGDVGLALYSTPPVTRSTDNGKTVLPYLYADYGNFYARVNTFGYKVAPLGAGHLELSTRISFEGYRATDHGIGNRAKPVPIGLSTFQETPYGAFFAYGFHDTVSGGNLMDLMYATELNAAPVHVYPQIGLERRSARYAQHLYGVSAAEAAGSGLASYTPGSATSPYLGLALEYPLQKDLNLSWQITKKWLGKGITDSPLVNTSSQTSGLLALTHVFR